MNEKLKNLEGSQSLPEDSTELDRFKYEFCKKIIQYLIDGRLTQKDLADTLQVDPAIVSKIVNYKIDCFTLDKLVSYYELLNPDLKLAVS